MKMNMKTTILAFLLAPLIPAAVFGTGGAANALLHPAWSGGTASVLGGLPAPALSNAVIASVIAWPIALLAFLLLRYLKRGGWTSYSVAGFLLGATYAFLTREGTAGSDVVFYLSVVCFLGISVSAAVLGYRRREANPTTVLAPVALAASAGQARQA
jgi:hypothetical protein